MDVPLKEAGGQKNVINLLMIHAEDHLMNALTVKGLAEEIINDRLNR